MQFFVVFFRCISTVVSLSSSSVVLVLLFGFVSFCQSFDFSVDDQSISGRLEFSLLVDEVVGHQVSTVGPDRSQGLGDRI